MVAFLMVVFAVLAMVAFVYAHIMRADRNEARIELADYISANDAWMAHAAYLESLLTDAQMHAYNVQRANGNGHKSELPLIVGKSETKIAMVDDSPVMVITEFTARNGKTVKLETEKPAEKKNGKDKAKETDAPALPENESISASDDTDKVIAVIAEIGELKQDEKDLIAKWESKKPDSVAEYVKRLTNRRESAKKSK